MKFYVLSDNNDTAFGLRLAGIEGEVIRNVDEVPEIGVVLMTEKLIDAHHAQIYRYKLTHKRPLIVEIPDRHGGGDVSANIERYVGEAIGVKL